MNIPEILLATTLALVLSQPVAADQSPAAQVPADPEVSARLVSNLTAIGASDDFEVAVLLDVPEGWHIHWSNPGEEGLATQARLKGPAGFIIRGPFFPGPRSIRTPSGLLSFGYPGEVALFFKVSAPRGATSGNASFKARVDWQMSRQTSLLGSAELSLSLPLQTRSTPAKGATANLLDAQRRLLPRPFKELGRETELNWTLASEDTGEGAQVALSVRVPQAAELSYFPDLESDMILIDQVPGQDDQGASLLLILQNGADARVRQPRARGVLRVLRGLEYSYFEVDATGDLSPAGS